MMASGESPDAFFFTHRGLREPVAEAPDHQPAPGALDHAYWADPAPQSMHIDEVEALWAPIAADDDWAPLMAKVGALRRMGEALGPAPQPSGHASA